ncbi:MAG TPA: hypothetical protein VEI57_16150 [Nitrospirota bacterium]|nr:hypothetical protein [Nitrospirota bacterium]
MSNFIFFLRAVVQQAQSINHVLACSKASPELFPKVQSADHRGIAGIKYSDADEDVSCAGNRKKLFGNMHLYPEDEPQGEESNDQNHDTPKFIAGTVNAGSGRLTDDMRNVSCSDGQIRLRSWSIAFQEKLENIPLLHLATSLFHAQPKMLSNLFPIIQLFT